MNTQPPKLKSPLADTAHTQLIDSYFKWDKKNGGDINFPSNTPDSVKKDILSILKGDLANPYSWKFELFRADEEIARIEQCLEENPDSGKTKLLTLQKAKASKHKAWLTSSIDSLKRLATDERMPEVFTLLDTAKLPDGQWGTFIHAAWEAQVDYTEIKKQLIDATIVKNKIAMAADKLAKLIQQYSKIGVDFVGEFNSIPELLMKTNVVHTPIFTRYSKFTLEHEQTYRKKQKLSDNEIINRDYATDFIGKPLPLEYFENWLELSPSLPELLETLSKVARDIEPNIYGQMELVTTRQKNPKNDYLRTFVAILISGGKISVQDDFVRHAIAITANVVINDNTKDITYDDVEYVINQMNSTATTEKLDPKKIV